MKIQMELDEVELLELIANETTSPAVALECATKVLAALDRYRNERDFQARPISRPPVTATACPR